MITPQEMLNLALAETAASQNSLKEEAAFYIDKALETMAAKPLVGHVTLSDEKDFEGRVPMRMSELTEEDLWYWIVKPFQEAGYKINIILATEHEGSRVRIRLDWQTEGKKYSGIGA